VLVGVKYMKEIQLPRLHTNVVIQGDERKLDCLLSAVEGPLGEVKSWLIQQCSDFLCGASSQAGDEPIYPNCQGRYGQNKCEEKMDGRVPIPDKCYVESPEEDQWRTEAGPHLACSDFKYARCASV
jgi:hypothetical protein